MREQTKNRIYTAVIIFIFLLLAFIIWLVYDYQIHQIDESTREKPGATNKVINLKSIHCP